VSDAHGKWWKAAPAWRGQRPSNEQLGRQLDAKNNKFRLGVRQATGNAPHRDLTRLACLARKIHRLGERPLFELFVELAAGALLVKRLEVYARLDPDFIAALGGDRLPPLR
jgi:hypothetical protein